METKQINVFSFNELSNEAKEHAIEKYYNYYTEYEDLDFELDSLKEKLANIGFENAKISFSGFCSQGDGASFESDVNLNKILSYMVYQSTSYDEISKYNNLIILHDKNLLELTLWIKRLSSHYSHENTCTTDHEIDLYQKYRSSQAEDYFFEVAQDLMEEVEDIRHEVSQDIYHSLEETYEAMQSEEYLAEGFENEEIEFLETGEMY